MDECLKNTANALSVILKDYKLDYDLSKVQQQAESKEELIDITLDACGLMYLQRSKDEIFFRDCSDLMLAYTLEGHPLIIKPGIYGAVAYDCHNNKIGRISKSKLANLKDTFYIVCKPILSENYNVKNIAKFVISLLSLHDVLPIALMILFITLIGLAVPFLYKRILYYIVPMGANSEAFALLASTGFVYLAVIIVRTVITRFKSFSLNRLKLRISAQIQNAIMARILSMDRTYFARTTAGKLSTNLYYAQQLSEKILNLIVDSSITTIFSLMYIPQMIVLGPTLWAPALSFYLFQFIVSMLIIRVKVINQTNKTESYAETNNFSHLILHGITKIKTSGRAPEITKKWIDNYIHQMRFGTNPPLVIKLDGVIRSAISGLTTLTVLIFAYFTCVDKASYITFCSSMSLVSSAISTLTSTIATILMMKPLLLRVQSIMSIKPKINIDKNYIKSISGRVEVKDLSFSYGDGSIRCLDGISLNIMPGQKVALVGMSGSGKSTLIDLLLGLQQPDSGHILYDGLDTQDLSIRSLRKQIASVLQYSKLVPGTVRDNVAFSNQFWTNTQDESILDEHVWAAIDSACLTDDVNTWSLGLDTQISDSAAAGVSGGQRQRILLARAIAQNKNFMILDEATSSLDNNTQAAVIENIYKLPCSVLMIAHRISTVQKCDKIYVINDGKIVEEGTYDELISYDSFFRSFAANQISAEKM